MSKTVSGEKTKTALALFQTRSSVSQLSQLSAAGPGETDRPRANPASGRGGGAAAGYADPTSLLDIVALLGTR